MKGECEEKEKKLKIKEAIVTWNYLKHIKIITISYIHAATN